MRKYTGDQERAIRVRQLVDEWTRSGLLDPAQHPRLMSALQVDLRRTNLFLRLTLFSFGFLIAAASVGLVGTTLGVNDPTAGGILCFVAAAALIALAEILSGRFRLYRFGVEEACAAAAVVLAAIGSALIVGRSAWESSGDSMVFVALVAGAAAAFAVYCRFGYVYAAIGAMLCAGLAPFQLHLDQIQQRLLALAILTGCFIAARIGRRRHRDEFPGDEYGTIQAAAWLGGYAVLNLHLTPPFVPGSRGEFSFYWFTFVMICLVPAAGLWWSVRDRDRPLLDTSLVLAVATLVTNKPYLGMARKPWDPILLGVLLIGIAVVLRRWLAAGRDGSRRGVTGAQLLHSDRKPLTVVSTASGALHPGLTADHGGAAPPDAFKGDGGRSGGAGGGASF